jgi:hypothetical protein
MRALTHIEKKDPGAMSVAAGVENRIFANVVLSEFIGPIQA